MSGLMRARQMSVETADRIVDYFYVKEPKAGRNQFSFTGRAFHEFSRDRACGGKSQQHSRESPLCPDHEWILLKNDEYLDYLVTHCFIVHISFDGPIQEEMRVDQTGRGTFQEVMAVIERIHAKYPAFYEKNVGFNVTVTPATRMKETEDFFNSNPLFANNTLNIIRHYDPDNAFCRKYDSMDNEEILREGFERLRRQYPSVYKKGLPFHDGCYRTVMAKLDKRPMGNPGYLP